MAKPELRFWYLECNWQDWDSDLYKLKVYNIYVRIFWSDSIFRINREKKIVLNGYSSPSFCINSNVSAIALDQRCSYLSGVIRSQLSIYAENTTIYLCLNSKSDRFNKVKLAAELKSYLQSVANWLINFNTTQTKPFSFNLLRELSCFLSACKHISAVEQWLTR